MLEIFLTIFSLGLGISGCWFVLKNKINKEPQFNKQLELKKELKAMLYSLEVLK